MSSAADGITILRAHGRCLAKIVSADGEIQNYDKAKTVDLARVPLDGLMALWSLLHRLEPRRDCCVVRGSIADPSRVKGVRRLLYRDAETGDGPTLREVPRRWVALDFDGLQRPQWVDSADLLGCACVAIETLPNAFRRARFIVQATGSHGLKPGIRIRLWTWFDRPVGASELKNWLRPAPLDPSIFSAAQITYTAAPLFLAGAFDPLPMRLETIPGDAEVIVPPAEQLTPPRPRINLPTRNNERNGTAIAGALRAVATAGNGNRNAALYWASRRLAERVTQHALAPEEARVMLEDAAMRAGLSAAEAAATVRSGLRHGGGDD